MAIGLLIEFFVPFIVAIALIIKVKTYLKMRAQEQANQSTGLSTPVAPGQSVTSIPQQSNIVSINKKSNNKDYFILATLALMMGSAIAFGSNYFLFQIVYVIGFTLSKNSFNVLTVSVLAVLILINGLLAQKLWGYWHNKISLNSGISPGSNFIHFTIIIIAILPSFYLISTKTKVASGGRNIQQTRTEQMNAPAKNGYKSISPSITNPIELAQATSPLSQPLISDKYAIWMQLGGENIRQIGVVNFLNNSVKIITVPSFKTVFNGYESDGILYGDSGKIMLANDTTVVFGHRKDGNGKDAIVVCDLSTEKCKEPLLLQKLSRDDRSYQKVIYKFNSNWLVKTSTDPNYIASDILITNLKNGSQSIINPINIKYDNANKQNIKLQILGLNKNNLIVANLMDTSGNDIIAVEEYYKIDLMTMEATNIRIEDSLVETQSHSQDVVQEDILNLPSAIKRSTITDQDSLHPLLIQVDGKIHNYEDPPVNQADPRKTYRPQNISKSYIYYGMDSSYGMDPFYRVNIKSGIKENLTGILQYIGNDWLDSREVYNDLYGVYYQQDPINDQDNDKGLYPIARIKLFPIKVIK
ncbi:hypothetical protein COX10_01420 [Candidatus Berkelbacteria bacterium CG23_combo_of_CG06-09_8_20_14_all_33_15]|nr:MAG: hypothetical protein COX10_01420 [Candidatus Berkelbacteria bacterium CG23_combo_of_CG06-09_8_20_14_all_33_15]